MPVEPGLELAAIVCLRCEDPKRKPFSDLVQGADDRALITPIVNPQDPDSSAVIYCSELVEALGRPRDPLKELHIHLQAATRLSLLIPLPALTMRLVLLVGRQPFHATLYQGSVRSGVRNFDLVETLQEGSKSLRPKMIVLAQVWNLVDNCGRCGSRTVRRSGLIG